MQLVLVHNCCDPQDPQVSAINGIGPNLHAVLGRPERRCPIVDIGPKEKHSGGSLASDKPGAD